MTLPTEWTTGVRRPKGKRVFSHHLVKTSQTSCPMAIGSKMHYCTEVKWPECDTDCSHPSNANVNEWNFTSTIRFMAWSKETTVRFAILWQRNEVSGFVPILSQKETICNITKSYQISDETEAKDRKLCTRVKDRHFVSRSAAYCVAIFWTVNRLENSETKISFLSPLSSRHYN